jgi:iron complex outermembrane receptor protein
MTRTQAFRTLLAAGCGVAALGCGAAQAADATATGSVEEVVVTAQKRTELLREVPAAVTAVTSSSLQNIGAARLDDYVAKIPGLTVSNVSSANGTNQVALRGLTTGVGGNPTVGIYIDDSPFGASGGFGAFNVPDIDPQDLQRVEVLRGPQGTLYGAGSLGGLLKYVTAAPDPSHFFGRMEVDGSTVDGGSQGYALRAAANMPLNEKVALRVSAYDRDDPGFIDNVKTGEQNVNDYRYYGDLFVQRHVGGRP